MLLHHDRVSCWNINDNSDRKENNNQFIKCLNTLLIFWMYMLCSAHIWMYEEVPYWAVLVRMDVRRACSSVRAEGTLVFIQSAPLGGLLTGLGWGSNGLRSSEPLNRYKIHQLNNTHVIVGTLNSDLTPGKISSHLSISLCSYSDYKNKL